MTCFDLIVAIAPNQHDSVIVAYACCLLDETGKMVHTVAGSATRASPRYVLLDAINRMVAWIGEKKFPVTELVVWMPNPDLLTSRLNHRIPEMTLPKRDTLAETLTSLAQSGWCSKNVQEAPHLPVIRRLLLAQVELPPEEALRSDASRMPAPKPSLRGREIWWKENCCGYIVKKRYISKRTNDHYSTKYNGWGIQEVIVELLKREGVEDIEIWYESDNGKRVKLAITLQKFLEWKQRDCLREEDGWQLFVHQDHFDLKNH